MKKDFSISKIHYQDYKLCEGEVEIILRALEIYAYNLSYVFVREENEYEKLRDDTVRLVYEQLVSKLSTVKNNSKDIFDEIYLNNYKKQKKYTFKKKKLYLLKNS